MLHVQYFLPPLCGCRTITTIHDILFESHPEFYTRAENLYFRALIPGSARRADHIITGSGHYVIDFGDGSATFATVADQSVVAGSLVTLAPTYGTAGSGEKEVTLHTPDGREERVTTAARDEASLWRWADTDVSGVYRAVHSRFGSPIALM